MSLLRERYGSRIDDIMAQYPAGRQKSAVLPLMHLAQEVYGYMSQTAKEDVAGIIGVDPTHILGLAGFYSLYYEEPVGEYVLEICNDLACALRGADQFLAHACDRLGVKNHGTTDDGLFTVKNVMCIGACDRAPVLQCNLKFHENLTDEKFDALIAQLRGEAESGRQPVSVAEQILLPRAQQQRRE